MGVHGWKRKCLRWLTFQPGAFCQWTRRWVFVRWCKAMTFSWVKMTRIRPGWVARHAWVCYCWLGPVVLHLLPTSCLRFVWPSFLLAEMTHQNLGTCWSLLKTQHLYQAKCNAYTPFHVKIFVPFKHIVCNIPNFFIVNKKLFTYLTFKRDNLK